MPKRKKSNNDNCNKRSKRERRLQGASGSKIPGDILMLILSRLPGSSLSRFRFVSKLWGVIIAADPILSKNHLDFGFKYGSPSILVRSKTKSTNNLTLIDHKGGRRSCVMSINQQYSHISPSCHGLICIYNSANVALFNPTTKQKLVLHKPTKGNQLVHRCVLGYTPTNKIYKVVRFYREVGNAISKCEILNVGTCMWRQIPITFCGLTDNGSICIGGVLYFIVRRLDFDGSQLVSFDLTNEIFETINCPALGTDRFRYFIFELESQICVVRGSKSDSVEIWMLNLRNRDWICKYKLMVAGFGFGGIQPVSISGNILVKCGNYLNYRNLDSGRNFGNIYRRNSHCSAQVHFESFVNLLNI